MSCDEKGKVRDFLQGNLDRDATLAVLDHARACATCREQMEEHSRIAGLRLRPGTQPRRDSGCAALTGPRWASSVADPTPAPAPAPVPHRTGSPFRRFLYLAPVLLAFVGLRSYLSGPAQAELTTQELWVARALESGVPVARAPSGGVARRPATLDALLPAGNGRFTFVVAKDGLTALEKDFRRGDLGCAFDSITVPMPSGKLNVVNAFVPFPDADELVLVPDARYFYWISLPNGRTSTPTWLRIETATNR